MKHLLLCLLLAAPAFANDADPLDVDGTPVYKGAHIFPRRQAQEIADDIAQGQDRLAVRTDEAISNMIHLAVQELRRRGFDSDATKIEWEYGSQYDKFLTRMVANPARGIGDHKPLVAWIDTAYKKIEGLLGVQVCKMLHLADLYSLNHTIPVCFHPCTFPMDAVTIARMDEYRNHFAGDGTYDGLVPIVVFWTTWGVCEAATYGAGAMWLCGPIGSACEFVTEKWLAPKLSDKIFTAACGG